MTKKLSVAAIESGTVIDHIPAGQGMKIASLLKLDTQRHKVTLGLNLPSQSMGLKDLIKVEGREITEEEANQIAIFAPKATLNIIHGFQVSTKLTVNLPEKIEKILHCPNPRCVTQHEKVYSRFHVKKLAKAVQLTCFYCEKGFTHDTF